jgi:EAL domain-containing protein (putative c-di-GMP-specific phosphodiesterase class I)
MPPRATLDSTTASGKSTVRSAGNATESVETSAQRQALRGMDLRTTQGYLFTRPLPAAALAGRFKATTPGAD